MSGIEIAAGVVAILSGFATGIDLYRRWRDDRKKRKARKQGRKEDKFDKSLVQGRQQIHDQYHVCLAQLGHAFRVGDDVGRNQIYQQCIIFKNCFIQQLPGMQPAREVAATDVFRVNIESLFRASETTKKETIRILHDQYQRTRLRAPIPKSLANEDNE